MIDRLLAYPTWLAEYEQQMELHGDDRRAASAAASAVADSVGSGDDIHMGALYHQNQTEWIKTFTVFGSWFNNYLNNAYRATQGGTVWVSTEALRAVFTTPLVVAILSALIVVDGPDPDDLEDDDKWAAWLAKWGAVQYGKFMMGMVPIVRDVASASQGFTPTTQPQSAAATVARVPGIVYETATGEGEKTVIRHASDAAKVLGTFVAIPGLGNFTRIADYLDATMRGKEQSQYVPAWYQAPVQGPSR